MHIAAGVEVGGQVIVGVAPLAGAFHPDLPAPDRRAQRHQDAQLVRDPLDPAPLIDHRRPPVVRDHMIQWYHVARRVGLLRRTVVALQQVQRVHHRLMRGVVTPETQRLQQFRQAAPVVVRVGGPQLHPEPGAERALVRPRLGHLTSRVRATRRGRRAEVLMPRELKLDRLARTGLTHVHGRQGLRSTAGKLRDVRIEKS